MADKIAGKFKLPAGRFGELLTELAKTHTLAGPVLSPDGSAVALDYLQPPYDLPRGFTVSQQPGVYRISSGGHAYFDHVGGPHSWKKFIYPPREVLLEYRRESRSDENFRQIRPKPGGNGKPAALVGIRPCDLRAIAILDRVLTGGEHPDPHYAERRKNIFVVAVNCVKPADTCFCEKSGGSCAVTPDTGHDIVLTELGGSTGPHYFALQTGSPIGTAIIERLKLDSLSAPEEQEAMRALEESKAQVARHHAPAELGTAEFGQKVAGSPDHPHWEEVSARCLSCGNCTLVCPTCFCSTVEDTVSLDGLTAGRSRRWDSCFTREYSWVAGGAVRESVKSRYRQWASHKIGSWWAQFGSSGCVGCGRCAVWCPVGIDISAETAIVAENPVHQPVDVNK